MPPTPEQTELGYHRMLDAAHVNPNKVAVAKEIARKIAANRPRYEAIAKKTGVPWPWIGPVHSRESDLDFRTHLHNGDSLSARTRHVPAGRPKKGNPPFTFEDSAVDALTMSPHNLDKVTRWTAERMCYEWEKYNGWGYLNKGNSPYLWSWTDLYHGGKYVADGRYDASHWDTQAGCIAIFKELAEVDPSVAAYLAHREPAPPKEVNDQATRKERAVRSAGVASGAAGGGSEGAKTVLQEPDQPPPALLPPVAAYSLIGVGVALVLVTSFLVARKKATIAAKWTGSAAGLPPAPQPPASPQPPESPAAVPPPAAGAP
jgi:lysozyme family protein